MNILRCECGMAIGKGEKFCPCCYEVKELQSENKKLKELVKKVEWIQEDEFGIYYCPFCWRFKKDGHAPDCEIKKAVE